MLNILHLEDDPNDAALVQSVLETGGVACTITRVDNRDDFVAVLERGGIDLILSDFKLPAFDGTTAMKIARAGHPDPAGSPLHPAGGRPAAGCVAGPSRHDGGSPQTAQRGKGDHAETGRRAAGHPDLGADG